MNSWPLQENSISASGNVWTWLWMWQIPFSPWSLDLDCCLLQVGDISLPITRPSVSWQRVDKREQCPCKRSLLPGGLSLENYELPFGRHTRKSDSQSIFHRCSSYSISIFKAQGGFVHFFATIPFRREQIPRKSKKIDLAYITLALSSSLGTRLTYSP